MPGRLKCHIIISVLLNSEMQSRDLVESLAEGSLIESPVKVIKHENLFSFKVSVSGHGCYGRQREEEKRRKGVRFPGERPG